MAARKSKKQQTAVAPKKAHIAGAGEVVKQPIVQTLETNYMPYAMSVILSRAIPEIDGFKPSHRKLLYTMYKMNLLNGERTKSANIVGQTMRLNPHGDAAIYDTMVRLSRGYGALLYPLVDSKGNFGKAFSRDMQWAAHRYTEAKLDSICSELFRDIDRDTVDFVDNYDNSTTEPILLPVTFPTILCNVNTGIAVGMASSICSFNLTEVCETAIALMKDPKHAIADTLKAPDFPGGAMVIYNREELEKIYETGRGSVKFRGRYQYDAANHCIDITEIPPTTTVEAIIDKVIEHAKAGKIREVSDIRDETGLDGLKITIDLKRGTDPEKLMQRLYKMTTLEDSFSCNFNILVGGMPRVMGVREILEEWTAFRMECVRRRTWYDLSKKKEKLHLLQGLAKILLDIDEAIRIIRHTEEEALVIPNLMEGFRIDQIQAEYVAEIKLRHLNREYILKRTQEIEDLEKDIAEMEGILASKTKIKNIIIKELQEVMRKYGKSRRSEIIVVSNDPLLEEEEVPKYPVHLFFTRDGYFKKITPLSLRMSGEHKLKETDVIVQSMESQNNYDLLFFTNHCQVYKTKVSEFSDTKASTLGEYIPSRLGMEPEELPRYMLPTLDYNGYLLFFFENGKIAKVTMQAYYTKTNRKRLLKAFSNKSPVAVFYYISQDCELLVETTAGRMLLIHTAMIAPKATKDTIGVAAVTLKRGHKILRVREYQEGMLTKPQRYRAKNLPAAGALPLPEDSGEQMTL